jgi:hypothetical protein
MKLWIMKYKEEKTPSGLIVATPQQVASPLKIIVPPHSDFPGVNESVDFPAISTIQHAEKIVDKKIDNVVDYWCKQLGIPACVFEGEYGNHPTMYNFTYKKKEEDPFDALQKEFEERLAETKLGRWSAEVDGF